MTSCTKLKASYDFSSMILPTPVVQWKDGTSSKGAIAKVAVLGILGMLGWGTLLIATLVHLRSRFRLLSPIMQKIEIGIAVGSAGMVAAFALRTLAQGAYHRSSGSHRIVQVESLLISVPEDQGMDGSFICAPYDSKFDQAAQRAQTTHIWGVDAQVRSFYHFDYENAAYGIPTSCFTKSVQVKLHNSRRLFDIAKGPAATFGKSAIVVNIAEKGLIPTAFAYQGSPIYVDGTGMAGSRFRAVYVQVGHGSYQPLSYDQKLCSAKQFGQYVKGVIGQLSRERG